MNDLVKFGGGNLPASPDDLLQGLQHVSAGLSGRSGGMPILRLLRDGVFAYGQENIEPEEGSEWAINPHSFQHGFACWGDGELLGEAMVPLNQAPPQVNELQDYGEPWSQQISFQLQCLTGEDTGVTVMYKSTSIGFLNMAKSMIDQIVLQLQHEPDRYVPVVTLECDSYHHKQYGKTYFPVVDVLRWIPIEGSEEAEATEDEPTFDPEEPAEEKPKARGRSRRSAAKPADDAEATTQPKEPEVTENAEGKSRRRRRRAS